MFQSCLALVRQESLRHDLQKKMSDDPVPKLIPTNDNMTVGKNTLDANDLSLGCQTSDSAISPKFHHLALLVVLVSCSSKFSPLGIVCLACGASVTLG